MTRILNRAFRVVMHAGGMFAVAFLVLPLAVVIAVSFTETKYLRFPPEGFSLAWYAEFFQDSTYIDSLLLSCMLALCATFGAVLLGVSAAVGLARSEFRGREMIVGLFLSPLILPSIVIGAAMLQYATAVGFARSFVALLISHIIILLPYVVRTTLASLERFDRSLEEAALDLGANGLSAFLLVTLPVIKPGVVTGALFAFIISWINVEVSMFQVTAALMTIPVKMFNQIQYAVGPIVAAVSAATIYLAVLVVLVFDVVVGLDKMTKAD